MKTKHELSTKDILTAIRFWIDKGAPDWVTVGVTISVNRETLGYGLGEHQVDVITATVEEETK